MGHRLSNEIAWPLVSFRAVWTDPRADEQGNMLVARWVDGFVAYFPGIGEAVDDLLFRPTLVRIAEERRRAYFRGRP